MSYPPAFLAQVPAVMGVINVTPDSFSDGGRFDTVEAALEQARRMVEAGVDCLDIGGESTRPGAEPVSEQQELDRVAPVLKALRAEFDTPVSVDTSTPAVIRESARQGASLINDVRALRREGALAAALEAGLPVCLMHMSGEPDTMQKDPRYQDVVADVRGFLLERIEAATSAGIAPASIMLDPGFGFGKTLEHNLTLLHHLEDIVALGYPVLVGMSRKSMLGKVTGRDVADRMPASVAAATIAMTKGAAIARVHDVPETLDAACLVRALNSSD